MLSKIIEFLGLAFWVEIVTDNPKCTYYFGPFMGAKEAEGAKSGYIEDLENEGAQGIAVTVKRCKPSNLTIFDEDLGESINGKFIPTLSGQLS
ncbi:DUF1816 domain-containing protein [Limnofasciculus baicalensis]|uniref:DUF1816 domain-containing protein n=1 Tax=Limnofasciculus baicalensis BBK-W-15 TaxID=2699891 RepID=A0AAE3KSI5_9CYAN|nr:DUF1816 domain-containing protein [Limnofasciculus baicalensis]MCP2729512.1 DUF1816 domain-containing protein [Limnofasciculus baicalensis BBK-W-15]